MWKLVPVQKEALFDNSEVACERFFSLAGCTLSPRRARIGAKHCEMLATLSSNMKSVHIDENAAAKEHLSRSDKGWGDSEERKDMTFVAEELEIQAELMGERNDDNSKIDDGKCWTCI